MALKQVAFVPVANGTRLVTASSLFARLSINLSPFAFELPALYLPFVNILKDLGLRDTLSVSSAKDLLSDLQKACGYQFLNPNEFRAVMEILYFICDDANAADATSWASEAIVPDDGCRLVHARSCVFIDFYGAHFVKHIDISRLRFVHQDLPERVCKALSIRKLSDVVVEELDPREYPQSIESIGPVSLASIKQKLLSKSFHSAVWGILDSELSHIPGFIVPALKDLSYTLESIAVKLNFVQRIYTRFLLLSKSLDVTLVDKTSIMPDWVEDVSMHRALFFVDQLKTHVLVAEPPTYISVSDVVAVVVSRALESPVLLPIGSLFLCPMNSETTIVDILKLSLPNKVNLSRAGDGLLGREILPQDAAHVQFHPLRSFYIGEIVAWRSQNGEKLKYGRVPENVRPSAGQALYRFKIEISPGVIELVLSSNVFSFKSISMTSEKPPAAMVDNYHIAGGNRVSEVPEAVRAESSKQQPIHDLQHGVVSADELVQAVHEMLSAAGVSMDVEKQSLLLTTITLQEHLKESQASLLLEQEKSEMAMKEADTAKSAWSCRVCLSNEVDVTIVPCGHVLCRRCSSAVSRCPFCRLQVVKTIRIFRP